MIPMRKHQIFYRQTKYLKILNEQYDGNVYKFFENLLMFGDDYLWVIHAYMYRVMGIRTRVNASLYIVSVFMNFDWVGLGIKSDIVYRRNIQSIKKILDMYGPPVEIKINNT